jgi:hypothetical protein
MADAQTDEDPYVARGRAIAAGGSGGDATSAPAADADPYVARGRAIAAQTAPPAAAPSAMPAANGDTVMPGVRAYLSPAPNTTYGSVLPLARDETTGQVRPALPSSLRDVALGVLDLAEGPTTGTVTPEGTNALAQIMMGGRVAPSVARGTGADILPTLGRNAPRAADVPPAAAPPLTGVGQVDPAIAARATATQSPTSAVPPQPAPVAPPQGMPRTVTTSDDARTIANAYYKIAESQGHDSSLTPEYSGKLLDDAMAKTQDEAGKVVAGDNAVTALQARLEALRGKPLTLANVQAMDEEMGGLIDKEYGVRGLSKVGKQLVDIQNAWRDRIYGAGENDVAGGKEGFDALAPARQAWSTAMKMSDLERIQARADATANPTTSFGTQIKNLVNSATKSRGYSDEEIAALKQAAERGTVGTLLHAMGSRLIPIAAGAAEAGTGGASAGLMAAITSHFGGERLRAWGNALMERRVGKAFDTLGKGAPAAPPGSAFAPDYSPPSSANLLLQKSLPALPMVAPGAYQGTTTLPNALWPGA